MKNILIIIFCFLTVVACNKPGENSTNSPQETVKSLVVQITAEQSKQIKLKTEPMQYIPVNRSIQASGILDVPPQNLVSISAPLGGFVKETEMLQGMKVKKGDLLATLEHPSYVQLQEEYLDAQEKLKLAESELERQLSLQAGKAGTMKIYQQSETARNQLQIQVKSLAAKLKIIGLAPEKLSPANIQSKISLYAPVSGYIKSVNTNIGKFAAPETVLFEIVDTEHMHVELSVYEKDIPLLKTGQQIIFTLSNQDQEIRTAHVYLIGKALTADRTIEIHGHLDKEDPDLIPGLYVNAKIEVESDSSWVIPESALVYANGAPGVFAEDGSGKYRLVKLTAGEPFKGLVPVHFPESESPRSMKIATQGSHALLSLLFMVNEE